jgi:RHS repeat-associated protein
VWVAAAGNLPFIAQPTQVFFYHPDHLGSSSLVSNIAGRVAQRAEYYPYGRQRYESSTDFDPLYSFTGKEQDQESGLTYFGARFCEPATGVFVSADPLYAEIDGFGDDRLAGALAEPRLVNLYSYAAGNPLRFIDSLGLQPEPMEIEFPSPVERRETLWEWSREIWGKEYGEKNVGIMRLTGTDDVMVFANLPKGGQVTLAYLRGAYAKPGVETAANISNAITTAVIGGELELAAGGITGLRAMGGLRGLWTGARARLSRVRVTTGTSTWTSPREKVAELMRVIHLPSFRERLPKGMLLHGRPIMEAVERASPPSGELTWLPLSKIPGGVEYVAETIGKTAGGWVRRAFEKGGVINW